MMRLIPAMLLAVLVSSGCSSELSGDSNKGSDKFAGSNAAKPEVADARGDTDRGGRPGSEGDDGALSGKNGGRAGDDDDLAMGEGGGKDGDENGLDARGNAAKGDKEGVAIDGYGELADAKCKFLDKKAGGVQKLRVEGGPPLELDVGKYASAGAGKWEGDDYVFPFKAYVVGNQHYTTLDATPRNAHFTAEQYQARIQGARHADCVIVAIYLTSNTNKREGCFLETTKIRMADGTERMARDVKTGDLVWNPVTKRAAAVTEIVAGVEDKAGMIELGFAGKTVVVTSTHPFPTRLGLKQAQELSRTDEILDHEMRYHKITHLAQRPLDPTTKVFNFTIDGDATSDARHMVLAEGIVSGDLFLQQRLEKERRAKTSMVARADL